MPRSRLSFSCKKLGLRVSIFVESRWSKAWRYQKGFKQELETSQKKLKCHVKAFEKGLRDDLQSKKKNLRQLLESIK